MASRGIAYVAVRRKYMLLEGILLPFFILFFPILYYSIEDNYERGMNKL